MKAIILPKDLDIDLSSSIGVYDYNSTTEVSKQEIILNKNTFSFLKQGTKDVIFDNSFFSIDSSEFLLMKSSNCLMTEKLSDVENNYRSVLFFFSNELVLKIIRKFEFNESSSNNYSSVYAFGYDAFVERFVDSLIDLSKLSVAIQERILEVKLEEIILYLVELKGPGFIYSLINNRDTHSQKFIQTIENNKLTILTLRELAFLCNMSISSFKREFKKHYSKSPIKWFQDKRLEYASHLIKEEKKRPSDIYTEIGYNSLSNFIQAYKIKYGVTPKQSQIK